MTELLVSSSKSVEAKLNYLAPMTERPFTYTYEPPQGVPWTNNQHEEYKTSIRDLRPIAKDFTLEKAGLQFLGHKSAVNDFWDEAELARIYYPEAEKLLKDVTGATRVFIFDHTLRRRIEGMNENSPHAPTRVFPRQPATRVHVDQTALSGEARLRFMLPAEAETLVQHPYAIVNLWRPIKGPVLDSPLAVCDARSVAPEDLIPSDLLFPERQGEIYSVRHNPNHRWFYAPQMQTDEILLLKCFDSRDDGSVARFAPHTAFTDPTVPANAPPRESIELRTYLFFGPQLKQNTDPSWA
jgi:hypothetical protein